jgi:hypothetical protein
MINEILGQGGSKQGTNPTSIASCTYGASASIQCVSTPSGRAHSLVFQQPFHYSHPGTHRQVGYPELEIHAARSLQLTALVRRGGFSTHTADARRLVAPVKEFDRG